MVNRKNAYKYRHTYTGITASGNDSNDNKFNWHRRECTTMKRAVSFKIQSYWKLILAS